MPLPPTRPTSSPPACWPSSPRPGPAGPASPRARPGGGGPRRRRPLLEGAGATLQAHLDRSNFAVEMHQAFLDVATGGTGCLLVEEAPPGGPSALRFTAVPLSDLVLEEGADGRLDTVFRRGR
ncbi:portal protein [Aerophototrophica crusticola]|uniref:portal protein n=1 Tax=Aerophototrophica crusticola TaxID=1709002 RepID=UPI00384D38E2